MKLNKKFRRYIILSGIFFLLIISFFAVATALIQKPGVQQYLLQKVCIGYGWETRTGEMELDILGASGIVIHDVEAALKEKNISITASSITINFSKLRLLTGELIPVSIDINKPVITIPQSGINKLFNKKNNNSPKRTIICRDGINRFNFKDGELLITGPSDILINNLSAMLKHVAETSNTYKVEGSGKAEYKGKQSEFKIKSTIDIIPDDMLKSVFSASVITENTPITWIPERSIKIDFNKGLVSSDLNLTGSPEKGIYLGGSLNLKSAVFTLMHKKRSRILNVSELACNLDASFKDNILIIDSLNAKNSDLNIDMDMALDLTDRHNPHIKMNAKSKFMSVQAFRNNYPYQITKPWLKDKLFPMFEEGKVRMDELVLNGTVDQFRHIRDKANQSIFAMSLTCENFTVTNMGIQIPVTGVSGSVDISDHNLKISGLEGVFGDSVINQGSIDVEGMIGGKKLFTVFVDGDFDIQELMSYRELYALPEKARQQIEKWTGWNGRLFAKTTIGYQKSRKDRWTLNGDYSIKEALYNKRFLDLPLRLTQMDFHFSEENGNAFSGNGDFGNTRFNFTGAADIFKGIFHADIISNTDMNQLIQSCLKTDKSPYKFKEYIPLTISVDKYKDTYTYRGVLDTEKLVIETDNLVFHTAGKGNSVSFDLINHNNDRLELSSSRLRFGDSNIFISGEYDLKNTKLTALKAVSDKLSMGDLGIEFKGTENVLFGDLKGSLDFDFPNKSMKGMQINGSLAGENISFIPGFLPLPVSECSFALDLSAKKGFIKEFNMKFGKHPLQMKGILRGWNSIEGDFLVTSDYIDLTEIIMKKASARKTSSKKTKLPITYDVDIKLNASRGTWRKLEFERLKAEMNFSDKSITIKNAQAELEKGDVTFDGIIDRSRDGKLDINSRINLDDQPVDKLISDTGFGDKGIKGTLKVKTSVNLKGPREHGMLKNLSGKVDSLSVRNGLIRNSKVFIKILDGLNIPDKFRERHEDMKGEGFSYHHVEGAGLIEKGILKTDNFVIKSPAFNAAGSGEINLYEQTYNLRLLLQPLTNLDYIVKKIPVFGPIFSNGNETVFTVGYDVKGPWSNPDLDYAPEENLKSLGGVLKRAFLTPFRIIENISGAAKKKEQDFEENKSKAEDNSSGGAETP